MKKILKEAFELPREKRALMADKLLTSLELPDTKIDNIWKNEVEARISAAKKGKMETVTEKVVFGKYKRGNS